MRRSSRTTSPVAAGARPTSDATTTVRPATWVWQAGEQARPLLELSGTGPGQVGTTCGASTDEKDFVWTQDSDRNGSQWNSIDIVTAPYTKDLSTLAPKKLRSAPGGNELGGCSRWKVQAGYAATYEHSANDSSSMLGARDHHAFMTADAIMRPKITSSNPPS